MLGTRTESLTLLSRTFVHLLLRGALLFYGVSSSLLFRPTAQRPEIPNCRRLGFGIERFLRKLFLTLDALRLPGSGLFFRRHRRSLGLGGFPFSLRLVDRFGACSVVGECRCRHKRERAADECNEQLAQAGALPEMTLRWPLLAVKKSATWRGTLPGRPPLPPPAPPPPPLPRPPSL